MGKELSVKVLTAALHVRPRQGFFRHFAGRALASSRFTRSLAQCIETLLNETFDERRFAAKAEGVIAAKKKSLATAPILYYVHR